MDTKEKQKILERYLHIPEEELSEMLLADEKGYKDGVYQLLLDAAKSRGFGAGTREILIKASSLQREVKEKLALQTLTPTQKRIFTILPGFAMWHYFFAPKECKQRKKDAIRCHWRGWRNYLLLILAGAVCVTIFSGTQTTLDQIMLIFVLVLATICISIYLHLQERKNKK
ncbi:MAG: hypothetical protein K9L86_00925 [Candidatus Omnitrophica bacterium]|nr:hypothetical protein [Candidatus Omnitrophota bacterium]